MPNTNQRTKDFHDSSLLFKPNSQNPSRMDFSFNKRKEQTHKKNQQFKYSAINWG